MLQLGVWRPKAEAAMIARLGIDVYIVKVMTPLLQFYLNLFQFTFWEFLVIKIKLDAGSHKPRIKGLKQRTERQHSWWLVWDSHPIRELRDWQLRPPCIMSLTFWSAILLHYAMNVSENLDPHIDLSLKLF